MLTGFRPETIDGAVIEALIAWPENLDLAPDHVRSQDFADRLE